MSPSMRDRLTGIIAVVVLGSIFVWYASSFYFAEATRLQTQIDARQKEVNDLEKQASANRRIVSKLTLYKEKSLPPQLDDARARYQEWLNAQVLGVKLNDVQIVPVNAREQQGAYRQLGFNVSARGDLKQVVDLFYRFYNIDLLQRMRRISLKPIRDSRDLDISLTIEVLSLADAKPEDPGSKPRIAMSLGELPEYLAAILNRNLLGPANNAPKLESISSPKGIRNQSVTFSARAKDADPLDKLTYSLEPGAPAGARVDPQTGAFRWTAGAPGTYPVSIRVTDDGLPAKSDIAKVMISVGEVPPKPPMRVVEVRPTPPPKPNLDLGKLAFVTALTEADGRPQVWISVRSTGDLLQLAVGEKWQVNGLAGTVRRINAETVEMELIDKKIYSVRLGENLSQAIDVESEKTATPILDP